MHPSSSVASRRPSGFTLIEVMIVVAIVAILSAIVLPSYKGYVVRGRLSEATSKIAGLRGQMEQYFQDNRKYGTSGVSCGIPTAPNNSTYFTFSCYLTNDPAATTQTDDQSFVLHAVGIGAMAGYAFTIDQSSNKTTTAFVGAPSMPVSCWISRPGDAC